MLYDYFPDARGFLVHVMYFESDEWLLVRQQDGKEENIVAPPRYSPSKKWLASVFWTEGPSDGNNGIDIVPVNVGTTEPRSTTDPTNTSFGNLSVGKAMICSP